MAEFRPIRSRSHPLVRRLRVLARSAERRREEQVYIAEGIRWAEEALSRAGAIEAVLVSPVLERHERGRRLRQRLARLSCPRHEAPDDLLDAAGDVRTPQGVVLLLRRPDDSLGALMERPVGRSRPGIWVVAVGVQDPGNLGGLLRTAHALGAAGFVGWGGADLFHPRAVRASAGALLRLPAARARGQEELLAFLRTLEARAAVPRGGEDPRHLDWGGRRAVVLGSEGVGLPPDIEAACAGRVSVPMRAGSESLNVAAAAAALLAMILPAAAARAAPPGSLSE